MSELSIGELEADSDIKLSVKWIEKGFREYELRWGLFYIAHVWYQTNYGVWRCNVRDIMNKSLRERFSTPQAAKAAVEKVLREME